MNILIACEESQRVVYEFRLKGHNAYSCDILECSGAFPQWHYKGDVLNILNGKCVFKTMDDKKHYIDKWDIIIAFPPCTHLAVSGSRYFGEKRKDGRQKNAIEFFCNFLVCNCDKICIENPVNIIGGEYIKKYYPDLCEKYMLPIKPTQYIEPWQFGDNVTKKTGLWLKGLKPLVPIVTVKPDIEYKYWIDKNGNEKRQAKWIYDALINAKNKNEISLIRSKTFKGIAHAMAEQWG